MANGACALRGAGSDVVDGVFEFQAWNVMYLIDGYGVSGMFL